MTTIGELETYRDLLAYLGTLGDTQLDQPIQVLDSCSEEPVPLKVVHAIGMVGELCDCGDADPPQPTRSTFDNDYHPGSVVLLADGNPFAPDGSIAEDLMTGERIYPKTATRDWTRP
jgi:hypothetical protein